MKAIIQVTQFFNWKNMSWQELLNGDEKGVLPSTDGTTFLWSETPKLLMKMDSESPSIGYVWLMEEEGKPVRWKANYDTSD
jgi:hypothetical protein